MPRPRTSYETMANVARLYYLEKMDQEEIGRLAGLSRSQVSRILKQAWEAGIVQVTIVKPPELEPNELAGKLRMALNLKKVVVVSSEGTSAFILRGIIAEACLLLEECLRSVSARDRILGVSWGQTLAQFAEIARPTGHYPDVTVVPLMGGIGQASPDLQVNQIAQKIALKLGGSCLQLHAPSLVDSQETLRHLSNENSVREVTRTWDKLSCALVGIGTPDSVGRGGFFNDPGFYEAVKREVCGDVCVNFFDAAGDPVLAEYRARTLACSPQQLARVPWCIGVAFGPHKARAIRAAAKSGMVNCLVTDSVTADLILREEDRAQNG